MDEVLLLVRRDVGHSDQLERFLKSSITIGDTIVRERDDVFQLVPEEEGTLEQACPLGGFLRDLGVRVIEGTSHGSHSSTEFDAIGHFVVSRLYSTLRVMAQSSKAVPTPEGENTSYTAAMLDCGA
jgi:hypothetical protein